jgi:hypothetical protein
MMMIRILMVLISRIDLIVMGKEKRENEGERGGVEE